MAMIIIDRHPFRDVPSWVASPGGNAIVRPFQVTRGFGCIRPRCSAPSGPSFPAILDTGLNHNFAIREDQLSSWTGLMLPRIGSVAVDRYVIPLLSANLWIYGNNPGEDTILGCLARSIAARGRHHRLSCPECKPGAAADSGIASHCNKRIEAHD